MSKTPNQYAMQDPRSQYPAPPFPRQPQPAPGLTPKMDPVPDHGEDSYRGFGRMEGRKALITGGDSGIGRATAIAYAREGAAVAINYLDAESPDAASLAELIESEGGTLVRLPGDLTDEAFCTRLIDDAREALGGLDVLVINAGKQVYQESIQDITTEQFDQTYKTNVYAMFWLSKAALPHLPAGASIINVTSIQGYSPSPGLLDYASTKWAIIGFTKALAKQAIEDGIRVNAVAPGPFWTPLQPSGGQPQDKVETFGEQVPYGRPGQPAEIAPTFVFLATQESGYITGEVFGVTGGEPTS
ncbi:SDR family oxidoreductase [Rubrivirga sp. IMCC43871]|uniref:SDR family oxidoreductase n=1 Tax=Rubrivirga sp. IMCC43871 TaxID=3391575 RepID=UPI00398FDEAC